MFARSNREIPGKISELAGQFDYECNIIKPQECIRPATLRPAPYPVTATGACFDYKQPDHSGFSGRRGGGRYIPLTTPRII